MDPQQEKPGQAPQQGRLITFQVQPWRCTAVSTVCLWQAVFFWLAACLVFKDCVVEKKASMVAEAPGAFGLLSTD